VQRDVRDYANDAFLSWLQESQDGGHDLLLASLAGDTWSTPQVVAHSNTFFVNWADYPSVVVDAAGVLWAHWLQRGEAGGYDYGIRVARSEDGGTTWSEPWTPHEDGTPTEHGFVSILPTGDGVALTWLDGRKYAVGADGSEPTREMTVRHRVVNGQGTPAAEELLDGRACDCCQTDAAMAAAGPVVVYRNRSEEEIRDIYITRRTEDGWTEGVPVNEDGWHIAGCPVNGPAVGARGEDVAVTWFTGAHDEPRVKIAFSHDGGATFAAPMVLDGGNPVGRVDLAMQEDGSALVTWLEDAGDGNGEIRLRRVTATEGVSDAFTVAVSASGRGSGFPRMIQLAGGDLIVAWTDILSDRPQIRVARVEVPTL
jgi:hypothetical protein